MKHRHPPFLHVLMISAIALALLLYSGVLKADPTPVPRLLAVPDDVMGEVNVNLVCSAGYLIYLEHSGGKEEKIQREIFDRGSGIYRDAISLVIPYGYDEDDVDDIFSPLLENMERFANEEPEEFMEMWLGLFNCKAVTQHHRAKAKGWQDYL